MIENYLGFPQGISGGELSTRATAQARRFGAEILLARQLAGSPWMAPVIWSSFRTGPRSDRGL